jgi:predicted nucleotidyltransferase
MSALSRIAKAAAERGLDFMLIGGHAVMAHGFARTTGDTDLMIRAVDRSKWESMMCELGWQIHSRGPAFVQFDTKPRVLEQVDLMTANPETFEALFRESKEFRSATTVCRVVSLHHLISLKCHAIKHGHAGRVEKDVDDVIQLAKINHLNVQNDQFREMILKYGMPELYDLLKRKIGIQKRE